MKDSAPKMAKKWGMRVLLLVFALYGFLAAKVHGSLLLTFAGGRGALHLSLCAAGIALRFDTSFSGPNRATATSGEAGDAAGGEEGFSGLKEAIKSPLLKAARRAVFVELLDVRARVGLDEAWSTALLAGGVRAAVLAALSVLPPAKASAVRIAPDFTAPGVIASVRCIFSVSAGDIMLAAASAAMKKRRKEGRRWSSIPSRT